MKSPGWYPSPDYPGVEQWWNGAGWSMHTREQQGGSVPQRPASKRASRVTLTVDKKPKPERRKLGFMVKVTLTIGLVLIGSGGVIQAPYVNGSRASYVITDGEIVDKRQWTNARSSYRRGYRHTSTTCAAKAQFEANGVKYRIDTEEWGNKCHYSNGEPIKVTYDTRDVHGTATTVVYENGINTYALITALVGTAICLGAWILHVVSQPLKHPRKRKR
jgi:hypothetical protein